MKKLACLAAAVAVAIVLLPATARAQFGSTGGFTVPQESGVSWPLTATGDLDMDGNEILAAGGVTLAATKKLCLDGAGCATYLAETSDDLMRLYAGSFNFIAYSGATQFGYLNGDWLLSDNKKLYFGSFSNYWLDYNGTSFSLTSTNVDGGGTDGDLITNVAGTSTVNFPSGDVGLALTKKLCFDTASGNDCIVAASDNTLSLQTAGTNALYMSAANDVYFYGQVRIHDAVGAEFTYYRNDNSPTNGDILSSQFFDAYNSTPAAHAYGRIDVVTEEVTAGDEDGSIDFQLTDNGTEGVSYLKLDASDTLEAAVFGKPIQLHTQTAASPTAPKACSVTTFGLTQVVNDSDDGAGTQVCYCGMTDDSTYDWLDMADNTACDHY